MLASLVLVTSPSYAGPTRLFGSAPAPSASADLAPPAEKVAPDSPRASLSEYFRLCRAGDFKSASRYLDLSTVAQSDGALLAQHLKEVLDRHLWVEVDKLSPLSHGVEEDGLAPDREDLGSVPGSTGKPESVIIVRRVDSTGARWLFASSTVSHIEDWYAHLENRWLLERLPRWALRVGPHELRWWQVIALVPVLLVGLGVGIVFSRTSRFLIRHLFARHSTEAARRLRGPATMAWTVVTAYVLLPWLSLYEPSGAFVRRYLSAGLLISMFWALWKAVEISQHAFSDATWAKNSPTASSLVGLSARMGKLVVGAFSFVAVLAELGYPVTSIITGLGIGGIALALAAQKTVENLFGAFSLAVDRPFREGDTVTVDNITGTVEAIGLRSTRIRTADRTIVTIPNGKLADMRIETVSARDRMRFYLVLGIAQASAAQLNVILKGIEGLLLENEVVSNDTISVRLIGVTDWALNVEILGMLETIDNARFLNVRQDLLLGILQVVRDAGASLAHPVSSIRLTEVEQAPGVTTPPSTRTP